MATTTKMNTISATQPKSSGTKRKFRLSDTLNAEEAAERKRFNEVVQKRMKLDESDPTSRRAARIAREKDIAQSRGVIYIGHIPHGFYEDQLRKYFSQFGEVTRVRVSRSRKTGGSRGYAFVEFLHDSVAKVAADTMNNYLMFERLLKCHVVPKEKVHPDMFSPRFPFPLNREITRTFTNMERTETRVERNRQLRLARLQQQMDSLKSLGIDYNVTPAGIEDETISSIAPAPAAVDQQTTTPKLKGEKKKKKKVKEGSEKKQSSTSKHAASHKKLTGSGEQERHVLLVDSDDCEIEFKTPPNAVRVLKPKPSKTKLLRKSLEKVSSPKLNPKKRMSTSSKKPKHPQ